MKSILLLVVAILILHPLQSQESISTTYGSIAGGSFDYIPEFDEEAPAVVLFDIGETRFLESESWYEMKFSRTTRIKVLTEEGLDKATFEIYYYSDGYGKTERVTEVEGNTYNINDFKIVKTPLETKEIFDEQVNEYWKKKVFTMPNVKVGSIIEVKYEIYPFSFFKFKTWEFQSDIPVRYSKYTARMIPFYEYTLLAQGLNKFDEYSANVDEGLKRYYGNSDGIRRASFNDMVYTYVMKDVVAFKDESYISSRDHHIMKLDFQLSKYHKLNGTDEEIISTWPKLTEDLIDHDQFGKYLKKCSNSAGKVLSTDINTVGQNKAEVAKAIIEYVKKSFKWDGFNSKYGENSPKELLSTKSGTSGEINLYLIALLRKAGVKATPVIISTRNHGRVWEEYPFLSFFNYVIAYVETESGNFLTDGTEPNISYNRIPTRCINDKGLTVEEVPIWLNLYSQIESLNQMTIKTKINTETLLAKTLIINNLTEFDSYRTKNYFKNDTSDIKEYYLEKGFTNIQKVQTRFYEKHKRPYSIAFYGDYPLESIDEKILVKPFLYFPQQENRLTQKTRTYPVDFIYKKTQEFFSEIQVPDGYRVGFVPENYSLDNSLMTINYNANLSDTSIKVNASAKFKKAVYQSNEYDKLRSYFDIIVKKFNEEIILEKID